MVAYRHLRSGRCLLEQVDEEILEKLTKSRKYVFKDYSMNPVSIDMEGLQFSAWAENELDVFVSGQIGLQLLVA